MNAASPSGKWTEDRIPDLDGKVALITGSNAGLGLEAARTLARHGARIVMACRNVVKAQDAAVSVEAAGGGRPVTVVPLDLASLKSVEEAATTVLEREDRLDLLLNNAGLMAIDQATTDDGFEMQFGVNHLGHFALTARLTPLLSATPGSRVVNQSSMGHRAASRLQADDLMFERRGYDRWRPYFQSKLANLLFTFEHQRRLAAAGSTTSALAAHPGASNTDLGHEGSGLLNKLLKPGVALAMPAEVGIRPMIRAATDPTATGGQFYGPRFLARGSHPVLEKPARTARDEAAQRALWAKSEELTGLTFDLG